MSATTTVLQELHHELRGSGPPVLFITGASGDAGHFTRAANQLADEFTTLTYDRRGCSRSAPLADDGPMSIAGQADDAAALVEELGVAPAVAFGTSGGGDILLELIARRPDVLGGAVVHEPALLTLADTAGADDPLESIVERAAVDPRGAMEAFLRLNTDDSTFEGLDPEHRERMLGNGGRFFTQQLPAFAAYVAPMERIRSAGVPMRLLVSDEGTEMLAASTEQLAESLGLPVSRLSGHHAPYLQQPEVFAEELRPILRELA